MPKHVFPRRKPVFYTLEQAALAHRARRAAARGVDPQLFLGESDPTLRSLMHMNLAVAGYRVTPFGHGADLLHALERTAGTLHAPDVVVSAIRMPGFLGLEILEVARLGPAWWIPFVLLAETADRELHAAAIRLGAQSVLEKPIEIRALVREACLLAPPQVISAGMGEMRA